LVYQIGLFNVIFIKMNKRIPLIFLVSLFASWFSLVSCEEDERPIISVPPILENVPIGDFVVRRNFLEVNFNAERSINAKTYSWNFGDGSDGATGSNINHTYAEEGSYIVILTITNADSEENTESDARVLTDIVTILVEVSETQIIPTADFSFDSIIETSDGFEVFFKDLTLNAVSYSWDFGVEQSVVLVTTANPSITFRRPGTYPVTLTVTSEDDIEDKITREVKVGILPEM